MIVIQFVHLTGTIDLNNKIKASGKSITFFKEEYK